MPAASLLPLALPVPPVSQPAPAVPSVGYRCGYVV
jgi:hypothetical protein